MKSIYLIIIYLFIIGKGIAQQNNSALYIEYQRMNKTDGYRQWFTKDFTVYSYLHGEIVPKTITVVVDGKTINTDDTVLYKEEFKEYIQKETSSARKIKQVNVFRYNNSNIIFYQTLETINNKKYIVEDTLKEMSDWEIKDEVKNILGYKCQKATTTFNKTNYIAYFTTDLHFMGGPKNFRGLPGIILSVETADGKFGFIATTIQYPYKNKIADIPTKGTKISYQEYNKLNEKNN